MYILVKLNKSFISQQKCKSGEYPYWSHFCFVSINCKNSTASLNQTNQHEFRQKKRRTHEKVFQGSPRIELGTSRSAVECSTTELYPLSAMFILVKLNLIFISQQKYKSGEYPYWSHFCFVSINCKNSTASLNQTNQHEFRQKKRRTHEKVFQGAPRIELGTSRSAVECSTTELYSLSAMYILVKLNKSFISQQKYKSGEYPYWSHFCFVSINCKNSTASLNQTNQHEFRQKKRRTHEKVFQGAPRIELGTSRSAVECSTTELYPLSAMYILVKLNKSFISQQKYKSGEYPYWSHFCFVSINCKNSTASLNQTNQHEFRQKKRRTHEKVFQGAPRIELGTSRSAVECSTTELYPLSAMYILVKLNKSFISQQKYKSGEYPYWSHFCFVSINCKNSTASLNQTNQHEFRQKKRRTHEKVFQGAPRIELGTSRSAVKCSTTELYPLSAMYILVKLNKSFISQQKYKSGEYPYWSHFCFVSINCKNSTASLNQTNQHEFRKKKRRTHEKLFQGAPRIELGTSRSAVECSTTELYPLSAMYILVKLNKSFISQQKYKSGEYPCWSHFCLVSINCKNSTASLNQTNQHEFRQKKRRTHEKVFQGAPRIELGTS